MTEAYEPRRCMSGHTHPGRLAQRFCDNQLRARVQADRAARPAQYQPIQPVIRRTPEWLDRSLKGTQRPMGVEGSN